MMIEHFKMSLSPLHCTFHSDQMQKSLRKNCRFWNPSIINSTLNLSPSLGHTVKVTCFFGSECTTYMNWILKFVVCHSQCEALSITRKKLHSLIILQDLSFRFSACWYFWKKISDRFSMQLHVPWEALIWNWAKMMTY